MYDALCTALYGDFTMALPVQVEQKSCGLDTGESLLTRSGFLKLRLLWQ